MSTPATTLSRAPSPWTWPLRFVRSMLLFLLELIKANLRVAYEVLTPGFSMRAAIIEVPTRTRSSLEAVLLANAISLTPGTLTLEVDEDTRTLYVHALYVPSREEFLADIARLEDLLLDVTRLRGRGAR
jgi:multicomponent Na+:H+ antiporter subunit E